MSHDQSEELSLFTRPSQPYTEPHHDESSPDQQITTPLNNHGNNQEHNHAGLYQHVGDGEEHESEEDHLSAHGLKKGSGGKPCPDSPCAIPPFDDMLGTTHEAAMQVVGFGRLQWILYITLGLALMGDGVELLMMAYVLPGAEKDFCMNAPMKGWLGAIAFAGMIVGALLWGNLADKIGRKPTLISALTTNAVFGVAGAFMPSYSLFFICRLLSGVGIGGSIPIVMAYASEFSERAYRGWRVGALVTTWAVGGVYCAAFGWLIIPNEDFEFTLGNSKTLSSWRAFILVCAIPVVLAIIALIMMPESPRFLLQVGRDLEALTIYRQLYLWNHTEPAAEYEMPEIELPSRPMVTTATDAPHNSKGVCNKCIYHINKFNDSFMQLFYTPLTLTTFVLMMLWFTVSFGYYGISIWFPEYIKRLEQENYYANTNQTRDTTYSNMAVKNKLENVDFKYVTFDDVTFKNIDMIHVTFDMCTFMHCLFKNVTSRQTYFIHSMIQNSTFNYTDFYPSRFQDTLLTHTDFYLTAEGCEVDFDYNYSQRLVLLETFVSQLAVIPSSIMAAFLLNYYGRVPIFVICLMLSGLSVFFIWAVNTEFAAVCLNAVFNCLINGAFNCLDVSSTEQYPTHLRATAFGFLSCLGRIAAILGNVTFGNLIDVSKAFPILITAFVLFTGSFTGLKLPESKTKIM